MNTVQKIVLGVIGALLVLGVFRLLAIGFSGALDVTADPVEPPVPEWHEVGVWRGQGSMSTDSFEIPGDEWRIAWNTTPGPQGPGTLEVGIYSDDGKFLDMAARVRGRGKGSKTFKQGGWFYIRVRATQPWEIQVRAQY